MTPRLLPALALLVSTAIFSPIAPAQEPFPSRPIRLVVPSSAGGPGDVVSRIIANDLSTRLGQMVIVENRPGAGNAIGQDFVANAAPDGYTLVHIASQGILNYHLINRPFDFRTAFTGIAQLYPQHAMLAVNPKVPSMANITNVAQLIAYAKANPTTLNYTSSGVGSSGHMMLEKIKLMSGAPMQHIPYKGAAPAFQDVIAGRIPVWGGTMYYLPQVKAGQIRAIAVGSAKRQPDLPDVPTLIEQGFPGLVAGSLIGYAGPAGMPRHITVRLESEFKTTINKPDVVEKMAKAGVIVGYADGTTFSNAISDYYDYWGKVIRESGIKAD